MSWLDEGLKFLQEAFHPSVELVGEKKFSNKAFTEIKPKLDSLPSPFKVSTLTALHDLITGDVEWLSKKQDLQPMIHIVDYKKVQLVLGVSDNEGRRLVFAEAVPPEYKGFEFDEYQGVSDFIVGVHAHFAATPDREYLIQVSSKITSEGVQVSEDDGISQQVTVNTSLALKGTEKLKSRVSLRPFRTFPDVDQPESEFILRAQKEDKVVELALFEADGGKWKVTAVENIAFRLRDLKITLPIIA